VDRMNFAALVARLHVELRSDARKAMQADQRRAWAISWDDLMKWCAVPQEGNARVCLAQWSIVE